MKALFGVAIGKRGPAMFARDARGVAPVEYVIMAALIGLAIMAGVSTLAPPINGFYTQFAASVTALPTTR